MWQILFLHILVIVGVQAASQAPASTLDYETFKTKVQPLFSEKRPGHARCSVCHSRGTAFRLQPLPAGRNAYNEEESRKNFEMVSRFVVPGVPAKSRLLTMPLAHEAGGTEFHPGGKHWESQSDPEWKTLAEWVKNAAATAGRGR
jgi:hypothetical protein